MFINHVTNFVKGELNRLLLNMKLHVKASYLTRSISILNMLFSENGSQEGREFMHVIPGIVRV